MAEAGITQVGEFHYLRHDPEGRAYADPDLLARRVIAAALRVGIRICLLRVAYIRGGAGVPLSARQARFGDPGMSAALEAVERLSRDLDPRVSVGLAPHSVRAVGREDLALAAGFHGPIHAHVSEQPAENEACLVENGCSPTALLEEVGLLSRRFSAIHLTHPLSGDAERLAAAGSRVCVCPTTELDLGNGFLTLDALRLPLCIGSDSHATIDPWLEARAVELHARGVAGRRNVMAPPGDRHGLARRILEIAMTGGAAALGVETYGIRPGAPADLVALDLRGPAAAGMPELEAAAFTASPAWVDRVWVGDAASSRAVVIRT